MTRNLCDVSGEVIPKGRAAMWQRFLDRFVPLMDDAPSRLDLLDGVGVRTTTDRVVSTANGSADAATAGVPTSR